jgi:hypothetical protein
VQVHGATFENPLPARGSARPALRCGGVADAAIKGSTTIVELLRRFPDGRAARLMAELNWACAHCGGAFHEPLTMAAQRHAREPRAVLEVFRALEGSGPPHEQVEAARRMVE